MNCPEHRYIRLGRYRLRPSQHREHSQGSTSRAEANQKEADRAIGPVQSAGSRLLEW